MEKVDTGNRYSDTEKTSAIAEVCHELNRLYCKSIGDDSQPSWEDAPDWQKQSAMNGVEFHLANPDAEASASHENWMKEKLEDGWIYGETKDPEKKTHHCIVPFEQLPEEQQFKDHLFKSGIAVSRDVPTITLPIEYLEVKDGPFTIRDAEGMVFEFALDPEGFSYACYEPVDQPTLGMKRVHLDFNPSGNEDIITIKQKTAELIDLCNDFDIGNATDAGEVKRSFALAMTDFENGAMHAVKAVAKTL